MKLRVHGLARVVVALCLGAAAAPLAAQPVAAEKATASDRRLSAYTLATPKPPFSCPSPQLIYQRPDGKMTCIAPDSNPCASNQVLDTTTKPGTASCKALPAKPPFTCPSPQLIYQRPDGKMTCIAPDSNPCASNQVLDTTTKPGTASCKALPAKPPFTCPSPQLIYQRPDGKMTCIAPDSNPCPQGQILDTTTKPGSAQCKAAPAKAPLACPAGQVAVQQANGRWVCVAKP